MEVDAVLAATGAAARSGPGSADGAFADVPDLRHLDPADRGFIAELG